MYAKKSVGMKVVVLLLAVVLLVGCTIGGTVAYLVANTDPVTNVFSVGNITITLDEKETADTVYKIVPGAMQSKKPVVTVKKGSEKCYVYVSVIMGLEYTDAQGRQVRVANVDVNDTEWILVGASGNEMVFRYHEVVDAAEKDKLCTVFTRVFYYETINEANIGQLEDKTIVVEAYAHQYEHVRDDFSIDKKVCDYFGVAPYVDPEES